MGNWGSEGDRVKKHGRTLRESLRLSPSNLWLEVHSENGGHLAPLHSWAAQMFRKLFISCILPLCCFLKSCKLGPPFLPRRASPVFGNSCGASSSLTTVGSPVSSHSLCRLFLAMLPEWEVLPLWTSYLNVTQMHVNKVDSIPSDVVWLVQRKSGI